MIKQAISVVLMLVSLWGARDLMVTGNLRVKGATSDAQVLELVRLMRFALWLKFTVAMLCLAAVVVIQVLP